MQKRTFTDQMGREIKVDFPPKRIISLVPSQTELLFDLGLDDEIVGITKFCIHPKDQFKLKTKIGGTKQLNIDKIRALKPDLIIGNKEENDKEQVQTLTAGFPVWMSDIYKLNDALAMIRCVGDLTAKPNQALQLANEIEASFAALSLTTSQINSKPLRVAYLIWKKPYMVAGKNTFINEMLNVAGFDNVFVDERYPEISAKALQKLSPDYIFLSSEPYPFSEKHLAEFQALCPAAKVRIVDGELFSWYGSRLRLAPAYLQSLIQ